MEHQTDLIRGPLPQHTATRERITELLQSDALYKEIRAARLTYERLLTSIIIAEDVLPNPSATDILVVYSSLLAELGVW